MNASPAKPRCNNKFDVSHAKKSPTFPSLSKSQSFSLQTHAIRVTMALSFFGLPCEIRNMIYELVLLHEEPVGPWTKRNGRQLGINLLGINRTAHREASPIFYGRNRFDLRGYEGRLIDSLLPLIGSRNASHVQHVCVDFGRLFQVLSLDYSNGAIFDWSFYTDLLNCCPNLLALTALAPGTYTAHYLLNLPDGRRALRDVLNHVKTRLGLFKGLARLLVEVPEIYQGGHLSRELESRGWTIKTAKHMERINFDWSVFAFRRRDIMPLILYGRSERCAQESEERLVDF
nr:hypothetical protein CFP56_36145 [Quercus suber]